MVFPFDVLSVARATSSPQEQMDTDFHHMKIFPTTELHMTTWYKTTVTEITQENYKLTLTAKTSHVGILWFLLLHSFLEIIANFYLVKYPSCIFCPFEMKVEE